MQQPEVARVVALGASNLTRGFHTVVSTARTAWGPTVQVLAALGHGRSYGARSQVLFRALPGILQSGLWQQLERLPPAPTRGLITDVGNDILYGFSAPQTLAWVEEAVDRLERTTRDIVITGLPLPTIRGLSRAKFLLVRSILFPRCRLSLASVLDAAERVDEGLAALASARCLRFFPLKPQWYGFDPIHVRPSLWRPAWSEILGVISEAAGHGAWSEGARLYLMPPERQWLFGVERVVSQPGVALAAGGQVWLY